MRRLNSKERIIGRSGGESTFLCGLDEAGRGPLAGPVSAAAVILPEDFPVWILDDSKKLSSVVREQLKETICSRAIAWGIGWVSAADIDEINIHNASLLAMKRAFDEMAFAESGANPPFPGNLRAVADGLFIPEIGIPCTPMVKADSIVPAVMAASILAKTARDRLMEYYDLFFPGYGYAKHKGYPTRAHREAILRHGPSPIQRMSFRVKR